MPSLSSTTSLEKNRTDRNDLTAIRREVVERAEGDIVRLAIDAGFRAVPRRPKAFHCIHGKDRDPSARIYRGRVHCFSCGSSWSPVDLAMLARGCGYVEALRSLAAEYSVPWQSMTMEQRAEYRRASAGAELLAAEAADFARGMRLWAERRKRELSYLMRSAWSRGAEEFGDAVGELLSRIPRQALDPDGAEPRMIVDWYRAAKRDCPTSAAAIVRLGRDDRQNAESITHAIVGMLARTNAVRAA